MATSTKTVNYTDEQAASIKADYLAGVSVNTIAANMGKSVRSIVAKLSRMEVYKKKEYKSKTGDAVVKKDSLADLIGAILKMTEPEIESLTKANKTALGKILKFLTENVSTYSTNENESESENNE